MKKRNIIICLLLVLCILPLPVFAAKKKTTTTTTTADVSKMVKVYIFEAGGCPACESEKEYLKGLDSYNKKFTIEVKELYVDHVNWAKGSDYELGTKVANAFATAKFKSAVDSTPLVVISDIYAENGYNPSLEETINKAYEEGDKDAVSCLEKGGKNSECVRGAKDEVDSDLAGLLIFLVAIGIVVAIIVTSRVNKNTEYYQE